ncbi:signal peptidase II [Micromonospora inyonensis]|uniref:Lipoprotein signal peptidase n=1 Tax=Micromonospora inyonensis TaxID=47866 RepID=A0A1C6S2F5_9ACTN|nr:signal peptidase II [Micromonospora inyonensis]SCL23669.1 signal peptidase II [Micromonospora inyonensis]
MTAAGPDGPGTAEPGGGGPGRRAIVVLAGTAGLAFLADQSTKHLALATLDDRDPVRLLGGTVYLTLTRNSGAAFSLGADHTWIFSVITLAVVGWIGWMALRLRSVPWGLSLGLVLGGAFGNLADRIFRAPGHFVGHVVDMVSLFDPYGRVWPVFNLADSVLVCGVALAVVLELTGRQRDGTRLRGAGSAPAAGSPKESTDVPRRRETTSVEDQRETTDVEQRERA